MYLSCDATEKFSSHLTRSSVYLTWDEFQVARPVLIIVTCNSSRVKLSDLNLKLNQL